MYVKAIKTGIGKYIIMEEMYYVNTQTEPD